MVEDLRTFINLLEEKEELLRIKKEVDPRHLSALIAQADKAVLFENIRGYDILAVGGLIRTRKRLAIGMGCSEQDLASTFQHGIDHPIPAMVVPDGPVKEVILKGDEVDLTRFPIPLLHAKDGGPYITSGLVVVKDKELGRNAGVYRLMFRTTNETSIDLVSHTDLHYIYEESLKRGESLPLGIALGASLFEMVAASYAAPAGVDELSIAGGLLKRPVELVRCETCDLEVPANAEIVLEGEILPIGWSQDEGPFGDFTGFQGSLRWNPVVRIKAITLRKNPIFYIHHMPWENDWLAGLHLEANAWRILRDARVKATAVYATIGSCCYWHLVASIQKKSGEGKNALMALLALSGVKQVIVTDDDVNIFDPLELERAVAFRVQPDKDVVIISGARGKHLDPSVNYRNLPRGELPVTSKMGIDATIPEGLSKADYERATYPYMSDLKIEDYL